MTPLPLSEKIAVVGMGCVLPDADNPDEFWQNVLAKRVSVGKVVPEHFDTEALFRPDALGKADKRGKSYTDLFASVKGLRFEGSRYRIPPTVSEQMDDNQKVALISASQALAGVSLENVDKERISVFMGNTIVGEKHHRFQIRTDFEKFEHHLRRDGKLSSLLGPDGMSEAVERLRGKLASNTQPITEDSAPGVLPNIIAARIASVFDFHGHAYVIDAACASGLAAVICGVQHLESGEADAVVCGAADMCMGEIGHIYFSGINALSPDGSFPFDERANGFVIGQGGGVLVLKRVGDALRDKDPILAVLAGYGQTSDGRGKAIAAPNPVWQARTITRAIEMAGFPADTVELIEAHGTATKVGDASEIEAMKASFLELGASKKGFCAVGSAKSNVGHLKSAAGIPGLVKTVQALRHKVLPPSANCEKVSSRLGIEGSPFYVATEPKAWEETSHPRRAGVSAFGFGGANYHIALEEFRPADYEGYQAPDRAAVPQPAAPAKTPATSHLALFSGASRDEIAKKAFAFSRRLGDRSRPIRETALEQSCRADASAPCRLAVVFDGRESFDAKVSQWQAATEPQAARLLRAKGIHFGDAPATTLEQTAFLFPGQASQYPDMLLDLVERFPSTARVTSRIDAWWEAENGIRVVDLISSRRRGAEETAKLLKDTRNTHPALLYAELAAANLLQDMGVRPAWMIGHSAGEVVALAACGKLSLDDAIVAMDRRGRAFAEMDVEDFGRMAAVRIDRNRLDDLISRSGLPVSVANINSPEQLIVSGPSGAIEAFCAVLEGEGVKRVELNVSHAFHSPVVGKAAIRFGKDIADLRFSPGHSRVMANQTCAEYPADDAGIRALLESQVTAAVDFQGGIEELYRRGVRLFIEAGPNSVLGNLTQSILKDREATVVSVDFRHADGLESLHKALAAIFAEGIPLQLIPAADTEVSTAPRPQALEAATPSAPAPARGEALEPPRNASERIVYSGVSVGLPGSYKKSFQDDNFEQIFEGRNFIERLSDAQKASLAELRVTKVEKTEQGPVFRVLETLEDVIQLAGRVGKIDPLADYALDPKESAHIDSAVLHAVAAGYEALRDAGIPLVREYARTASGKIIPDGWVLPQGMQKRTGVIFAHGFPMVEPVIAEVSRHVGNKFGSRLRSELVGFYETLLGQIRDPEAKRLLTNWFSLHHHRLSETPGGDEVYSFNHQFIQQISSLANNRLASHIHALGPNFQINAACSSTCTAVSLAQDMIRSGRADRFLVVGADDPTSEASMPYIGAGFLSTGAASCEADLYKAALPFDLRRNGMIMSAGAVGIVVEREDLVRERGARPVCELLGSHVFNTAGHHARLDVPRYAQELDEFMGRMEAEHGIARSDIAPKLLYLSHETYTPARGGCSQAEAVALRHAFGERFTQIEVANTKGMTGHTMGASIEDVVAARALELGRTPPVVNHQVPDPALAGLKLSRGGTHSCQYALRMAAGFGSQGNYVLLRKVPGGPARIADPERHRRWLAGISGQTDPETELAGRILRVKDKIPGALLVQRPLAPDCAAIVNDPVKPEPAAAPAASAPPPPEGGSVQALVLQVVSEITGYPPEMLEPDMEIEADLGVDTVKQATILATLGERLGHDAGGGFRISAYPTIGHVVRLFSGPTSPAPTLAAESSVPAALPDSVKVEEEASPPPKATGASVGKTVLEVVSEITGYPPEMLEPDMEIEADLGVDTVKQATILATLGERLGHDAGGGFQISAYPTIGHIVQLFSGPAGPAPTSAAESPVPAAGKPAISAPSEVLRQVLRLEDEPLGEPDPALAESSLLVWGQSPRELAELARRLSPSFRQVRTLLLPGDGDPDGALEAYSALEGFSADIWLDLGNLGEDADLFDLDPADARRELSRTAECRYAVFLRVQESSSPKPRLILSVARSSDDPAGGFLQGLHQSLAKEWETSCRLLEADGADHGHDLPAIVLDELSHRSVGARISYRSGRRQAWKLVDAPVDAASETVELGEEDTVLVTGGANGIASPVVVELARRFPARFLVLGRTAPGDVDFADGRWEESELPRRKEELKSSLAASGARMTPVALENEFSRLLKQREIARTLQAVRALGREIRYLSADVADFDALGAALQKAVSSTGPITAVVHAAGLDISHRLDRKSLEEFSRVHRVKTLGALHLARLCPPGSLKLFAAFTSISGVFGNAAQLDYGAANAFLDASVRRLRSRHPGLHATSLAWSGWSELGMAWRNAYVRENAEASGLHLIPSAQATQAALRELRTKTDVSPVVLHKGLGGMLDERWRPHPTLDDPLIDRIETDPSGLRLAFHTFSVEHDEFLNQHRLNKVPLMPGVGFMEFMSEFHARLEPPKGAVRFSDLSFHEAFKLFRDQPREAWIQARATATPGEWDMRIFSEFTAKIGGRTETRDYSAAKVSTGDFAPPAGNPTRWTLENPTRVPYSQILSHLDRIPQNVVFGPLFHDSRRQDGAREDVVVSWSPEGLHAPYRLPSAQLDNPLYPLGRFRLNPCLLDSIHQAGVIHTILLTGNVHLPFGAGEFVVAGKSDRPGLYQVRTRLVERRTDELAYDIELVDETGRTSAWVNRSTYRRINS